MSDEPTDETSTKSKGQRVVSLVEKRSQRASEGEDKMPLSEAYRAITNAINRQKISLLPEFPLKFYVVETSGGIKHTLREASPDGVVEYVNEEAITNAILHYTATTLLGRKSYGFEYRHARDAMKYWKAFTEAIKEPPAILWADEAGLCFSRLPWRYSPDFEGDKTPLFSELMQRTANSEALMHWIGSLFDPKSSLQQYVWLYGEGQNGKGALSRFLRRVFGRSYRSMQPPTQGDKHWTSGLVGSRLVVFPDCNASAFPASGLFKSLTGGDPISIDPKGKSSYTTELNCKFMFLSNERPTLSSEKADTRRAIYCEVEPLPEGAGEDLGYEERLWEEGGYFLSTCIHNYRKAYPQHGPIRVDSSVLEGWVSIVEEPFEVVAQTCFNFGPSLKMTPREFTEVLDEKFKTPKQKIAFRAYLTRKYGIGGGKKPGEARVVKVDGKTERIYIGASVKSHIQRNESIYHPGRPTGD